MAWVGESLTVVANNQQNPIQGVIRTEPRDAWPRGSLVPIGVSPGRWQSWSSNFALPGQAGLCPGGLFISLASRGNCMDLHLFKKNTPSLDDDERPELSSSLTGSIPDLTALLLGSEGDSLVTLDTELNPPELESANDGTRPTEMDSEVPSGTDLSPRKRRLTGAARKRLRRLKAGGMDPIEAYKLVTERLASAHTPSTGLMADMSSGKRPVKRSRSEDESPKDHVKKTTRVDEKSGSIPMIPDEPSATQVGPPPETSAMSFKDALTNIRVGIRNKEPMSDAQLGLLYKDILRAILNAPMPKAPEFKIRIEGCTFKPGWLQVVIKNDYSLKWLEEKVGTLKPWPEAELSFINEKDLPKAKVGILHFKTEDVLKTPRDALNLLEKQNDLQTGLWKVLSVKKERDGITTALSIDDASVEALRKLDCRPQLGFRKVWIRIRGDNTPARAEQVAGTSQSSAGILPPAQHAPRAGPSVQVSGKTAKRQNAKPKPGGQGVRNRPLGAPPTKRATRPNRSGVESRPAKPRGCPTAPKPSGSNNAT